MDVTSRQQSAGTEGRLLLLTEQAVSKLHVSTMPWYFPDTEWRQGSATVLSKVNVKVTQSCPTLCDPMDCVVHEILQARILEWVAFPFSRGSSQPRDQTQVSRIASGFFTNWAMRESTVKKRSEVLYLSVYQRYGKDRVSPDLYIQVTWFVPMNTEVWNCCLKSLLPSEKRGWIERMILTCIREGNGTPLQYSCLENPMGRGAW